VLYSYHALMVVFIAGVLVVHMQYFFHSDK
jgi:hypothetical protein